MARESRGWGRQSRLLPWDDCNILVIYYPILSTIIAVLSMFLNSRNTIYQRNFIVTRNVPRIVFFSFIICLSLGAFNRVGTSTGKESLCPASCLYLQITVLPMFRQTNFSQPLQTIRYSYTASQRQQIDISYTPQRVWVFGYVLHKCF